MNLLFNNQDVFNIFGGNPVANAVTKNFTGGPWIFTRTAQSGGAETVMRIGVSDCALDDGSLNIENGSTTNNIFNAVLRGFNGTGDATGLLLTGQTATDATTTSACIDIRGRIGSSTIPSVKPAIIFRAGNTEIARFTGAGGFVISGGATPSLRVGSSGTDLTQITVYAPSLTPASVNANTTAEQTFTVTGLATTDKVFVDSPASLGNGLGIAGVRVSAADTLAIRFSNATAGSLTPVSGTYPTVAVRS